MVCIVSVFFGELAEGLGPAVAVASWLSGSGSSPMIVSWSSSIGEHRVLTRGMLVKRGARIEDCLGFGAGPGQGCCAGDGGYIGMRGWWQWGEVNDRQEKIYRGRRRQEEGALKGDLGLRLAFHSPRAVTEA